MSLLVTGRLQGEHFVRQGRKVVAAATVSLTDQMDMVVYETGERSLVFTVKPLECCALRRADGLDTVSLDQDGAPLQRAAIAVDEPDRPYELDAIIPLWHVFLGAAI